MPKEEQHHTETLVIPDLSKPDAARLAAFRAANLAIVALLEGGVSTQSPKYIDACNEADAAILGKETT